MSTSLLYHGFGVRGYDYVRTEYLAGQILFTIRQPRQALRCPACGSRAVRPHGAAERQFLTAPIGAKAVLVKFAIPRVGCQACGVTRQVAVDFADPRRTYTKAFEGYALERSRHMTIRDVARHLGVSWDVVKDIPKRDLSRRYAKPKLKGLRWIVSFR
jgi:transposase